MAQHLRLPIYINSTIRLMAMLIYNRKTQIQQS
ncbi:Uncharacterised protein [Vibrio cholerae]|nr:Uncharacterised protein [Vibrio cholerae]